MATNIMEGELTSECSDTTPLAHHDGSQLELAKDSLCEKICGPLCWLCDPHKSAHAYVIVLLLCVAYLSLIFCIGNPAPLESSIVNVMQVDITQYELLFAVYSWPNAIVPLLGGLLIDKLIGLRVGFILFITQWPFYHLLQKQAFRQPLARNGWYKQLVLPRTVQCMPLW